MANEDHGHQKSDRRTRLAEGRGAAVDLCGCGTVQLHVGATTLRLEAGALSELASVLGRAAAAHSQRQFSEGRGLFMPQERGDA